MENDPISVSQVVLNRLDDPTIKLAVADIFCRYYEDLLPVLVIATAEADGVRPEGLSNEVYACFHHIARALCENEASPATELNSANKSHLKRAILDSYKIAVHSYLAEESQAKELLDYMVLVKEFADYIPDGIQKAAAVKAISRQIKASYKSAKLFEMVGAFDKAITEFSKTLDLCEKMRDTLAVFTSDRTYVFACEREAQRKIQSRKDYRLRIWIPILCAILAAILTYFIPRVFLHFSGSQADSGKNFPSGSSATKAVGAPLSHP